MEVTVAREPHRVPHRGGLLAGVVNIRGELHLCARLDRILGMIGGAAEQPARPRMVVIRHENEPWVFAADEVDQVHRVPRGSLSPTPPTLTRSAARVTRGVFTSNRRAVGLLDDVRLFQSLREQVR